VLRGFGCEQTGAERVWLLREPRTPLSLARLFVPLPSAAQADAVDIPGSQLQLINAVLAGTQTPVVVVLLHCRPATFGAGPQAVTGPYNGLLVRRRGGDTVGDGVGWGSPG
jgi:hypothetical protein